MLPPPTRGFRAAAPVLAFFLAFLLPGPFLREARAQSAPGASPAPASGASPSAKAPPPAAASAEASAQAALTPAAAAPIDSAGLVPPPVRDPAAPARDPAAASPTASPSSVPGTLASKPDSAARADSLRAARHRRYAPWKAAAGPACREEDETALQCLREEPALVIRESGFPGLRDGLFSLSSLEPRPFASQAFTFAGLSPYGQGGAPPPGAFTVETRGGEFRGASEPFHPVTPLDTPITALSWERGALALNLFGLSFRRMLSEKSYLSLNLHSVSGDSQYYDYPFQVHQPYLSGWLFLGALYPPINRDSGEIVLQGNSPSLSARTLDARLGFWLTPAQPLEFRWGNFRNTSNLARPAGLTQALGPFDDTLQVNLPGAFRATTLGVTHGFRAGASPAPGDSGLFGGETPAAFRSTLSYSRDFIASSRPGPAGAASTPTGSPGPTGPAAPSGPAVPGPAGSRLRPDLLLDETRDLFSGRAGLPELPWLRPEIAFEVERLAHEGALYLRSRDLAEALSAVPDTGGGSAPGEPAAPARNPGLTESAVQSGQALALSLHPRWEPGPGGTFSLEGKAEAALDRRERMDGEAEYLEGYGAEVTARLPFGFSLSYGAGLAEEAPSFRQRYAFSPYENLFPTPALHPRQHYHQQAEAGFSSSYFSLSGGLSLNRFENNFLPRVLPHRDLCARLQRGTYRDLPAGSGFCIEEGASAALPDSLAFALRNYDEELRDLAFLRTGTRLGNWNLAVAHHFLYRSRLRDERLAGPLLSNPLLPGAVNKGTLAWGRPVLDGRLRLDLRWNWEWFQARQAFAAREGAGPVLASPQRLDEYLVLDFITRMQVKSFVYFFKIMNLHHDRYRPEPGVFPPGVNFRFGIDWTLMN